MSEEEEVKLIFQESERERSAGIAAAPVNRIFDIDDIQNWFKTLKVKEIELKIETSVKSGKIVNLFVSAEGKGGLTVTLVPKTT